MKDIVLQEPRMDLEEYTTDFKIKVLPVLDKVLEWIKEGYTEYSIADKLGIHYNTFARYREKYSVIRELYTRATHERNSLVMNAMFKKSTGITQKIDQQKVTKDGDVIDFTETIYVAPDVNAADLYLRNNSEEYKSAKSDSGSLTLIQNNFQLPELKQQLLQIEQELKKLESGKTVEVEVLEGE
jgi:hypothetical protein